MGLPSLIRRVNLTIRVYPPVRFLYRGAIVCTTVRAAATEPKRSATSRCATTLPTFPLVTNFSIKGRTAFAFASVVLIFPLRTKDTAKARNKAVRWFRSLPNFLFLL